MKRTQAIRTNRPAAPRADLPTPLAQVLAELDRETQPFRAMHRLIDAVEVLIKLHTVLLVSRFAESLESEAAGYGPSVRKLLAGGLRTPSLGIWWAFAREAGSAMQAAGLAEPVAGLFAAVASKSPLFQALEGNHNLITLRNSYAHGATPDDETCRTDLAAMRPKLDALLDAAWPLVGAEFLAVDAAGRCLCLRGEAPSPLAPPPGAQAGRCYLRRADGSLLDLHPLLVWTSSAGKGTGAFFYNDMRKTNASVLHYAWARHERRTELRDDLLARYPLDQWGQEASTDEAEIRERIAALTENFKGRRKELQVLVSDLANRDRGFTVLWAPPGMGKSALMARAVDYLSWSDDTQRDAYPEFTPPAFEDQPLNLHVVRCFVRRGGFTDVRELFETLNRQLDRLFPTGVPGAANAAEAASRLGERLRKIGPKLPDHTRLLVVIDGLDEAAEHPEFVRGLPRTAPQHVHILYASRPQPVLRTEVYEQLEITQRTERTLEGLSKEDTRALLYEHTDKYAIDDGWVEAVAKRSEGDPLYLRLLCAALERGEISVNHIDAVPRQMGELYDGVMRRVALTPHAEELLALLAAAHAYLTVSTLHFLLGLQTPGLSVQAVRTALEACAEVLLDDPATPEDDWQLFHESLREYLHDRHAGPVIIWQRRLADWGQGWRTLSALSMAPRDQRATETYALRWTAVHLEETMEAARQTGQADELTRREGQLLALVEDEAWRARSFLLCGNAEALRRGVQLAQQVAVARFRHSQTSADALRVARFAQWTWGEELRLYEQQRQQLKQAHKNKGTTHWRDVVNLAAMGARPRDRMQLAALALWGERGRQDTVPDFSKDDLKRFQGWLDEADNTAVTRLWHVLGGPRDATGPASL
ncbi:MAG: hypothetical protein RLZ81_912 [Pseudomonadota bacterium]|jgi:hypothetical protein